MPNFSAAVSPALLRLGFAKSSVHLGQQGQLAGPYASTQGHSMRLEWLPRIEQPKERALDCIAVLISNLNLRILIFLSVLAAAIPSDATEDMKTF